MTDLTQHKLLVGACLTYLILFAVGLYGYTQGTIDDLRTLRKTQMMTQTLTQESERLMTSAYQIQERKRDADFLQSLVNILPKSKSFIRTQRAISDEVEVLRYKVARVIKNDLHVLVDTRANKLYVKKGLTLLWEADCSVGRGGLLTDKKTGRRWEFATPRGQFDVRDIIENPLWRKPDWAFVEENKPVPPPGDPSRQVPGELGAFVFNLGDGYLIHGTRNEAALGRSVSHGCVRLGAEDLKKLHETVRRWTRVYIY